MPRIPSHGFVAVYDDVLSEDLCKCLIQRFEASEGKEPGLTGYGLDTSKKTSTDLTIDLGAVVVTTWHPLLADLWAHLTPVVRHYLKQIRAPLCATVSPKVDDPETGESVTVTMKNWDELEGKFGDLLTDFLVEKTLCFDDVNIQKYDQDTGGYHIWHSEIAPEKGGTDSLHRILFWLVYLNDVEVGGETEFYFQGLKIPPKRGRVVLAPAGFTHTHRGNVPLSSDKYVATSWIKFKPASEIYDGH